MTKSFYAAIQGKDGSDTIGISQPQKSIRSNFERNDFLKNALFIKGVAYRDEEGRTFIHFTHGTMRERLNSGNDKAAAIFQELESCNLIE